MKATTTVGFVGLGNMGLPMCLNLVSSGVSVVALDTNPVAVRQAQEGGAQPAGSIDDIAECSVVITMLPGCSVVDQVMESLLPRLSISEPPTTTILVDCSTVSPSTTHRWFDRAQQDGHILLDAPVSGGVKGAKDATLTFLVGGYTASSTDAAESVVKPLLEYMGQRIIKCGGPGTGSATKLCNNLALAAQMIGICEAMNLGETLGVDPNVLADAMNQSTAKSWSCEVNNPHPSVGDTITPAKRDYDGGFASRLMLKDLGLAVAAAEEAGVALPQGTQSKELYRMATLRGHGEKDFGVLFKFLQGK